MRKTIKTLIYGEKQECSAIIDLLQAHPCFVDNNHEYCDVDDYEQFHVQLIDWDPDLVIVKKDGAAGMEGVYLVNTQRPLIPILWFSDDKDFSMQSHRLDCVYFSVKPATPEKLDRAIRRCKLLGMQIGNA